MAKKRSNFVDNLEKMKVRLTFIEPLLGTIAQDPEIYDQFIGSKHPDGTPEDERLAQMELSEAIEKDTTGFLRQDGKPCLWDYQIRGFFKETQGGFNRIGPAASNKHYMQAYKKVVDKLVFVKPRIIPLILPKGAEITMCQRPLRGSTPKGETVSLVKSEDVPAGTTIDVEIGVLNVKLFDDVCSWLDYGVLSGLGQWRNSGKGRFSWEDIG